MIAFVVDDDPDQRDLMCQALERHGWRVEVAEDGLAALGRVRQVRPDLILLDLLMPHLDGTAFLKMLRSTPVGRLIRVVVVTGAEAPVEVRALADEVLAKPFAEGALPQVLRQATPKW
jgi:CheY-like chemotaxis protein